MVCGVSFPSLSGAAGSSAAADTGASALDLNREAIEARNRAKAVSLLSVGTLGMGMPAAAMAEATASVSTGFSSLSSVISSTKPHSRASLALSQPPSFIRLSRSACGLLVLAAYIAAMLLSSLFRSLMASSQWPTSCASWSALRLPHSKNSMLHLCTRYMAEESIEMCLAPSEATVAALAFMPTKWTVTSP